MNSADEAASVTFRFSDAEHGYTVGLAAGQAKVEMGRPRARMTTPPQLSQTILRRYERAHVGCPMTRHPFQDAIEGFVESMQDPILLYNKAVEVAKDRTRKKVSGIGGGLYVETRAMHRAIAIGSVAAWEAVTEDLLRAGALYLRTSRPKTPDLISWWPPQYMENPGPWQVRKMYWQYFGFDPQCVWRFSFGARGNEVGRSGTYWSPFYAPRLPEQTIEGEQAAQWLASLMKLRHGNVHADPKKNFKGRPEPGVASAGNSARWGVAQHHAQNAIGVITQVALSTLVGLADHLKIPGTLRQSKALGAWKVDTRHLWDLEQWPA